MDELAVIARELDEDLIHNEDRYINGLITSEEFVNAAFMYAFEAKKKLASVQRPQIDSNTGLSCPQA